MLAYTFETRRLDVRTVRQDCTLPDKETDAGCLSRVDLIPGPKGRHLIATSRKGVDRDVPTTMSAEGAAQTE
jgi:hypothetical protein